VKRQREKYHITKVVWFDLTENRASVNFLSLSLNKEKSEDKSL
jgi:hypothetical protein